jgi:hypothetical protein
VSAAGQNGAVHRHGTMTPGHSFTRPGHPHLWQEQPVSTPMAAPQTLKPGGMPVGNMIAPNMTPKPPHCGAPAGP